jgi:lipopolysaccharide biosynthesis protein
MTRRSGTESASRTKTGTGTKDEPASGAPLAEPGGAAFVTYLANLVVSQSGAPWRALWAHYELKLLRAASTWAFLSGRRREKLKRQVARRDPARHLAVARLVQSGFAQQSSGPVGAEAGPSPDFKPYDPTLPVPKTDVTAIAFYLPQFHPFDENDRWWGKGFTEWTNVGKARPLFQGHYQPHCPIHLGYYDLRLPEVMEEQARIARRYGVGGFAHHFYWFAGRTVMERPLRDMLGNPAVEMPFFLSWANENWTRRWDGLENEVLLGQTYGLDDARAMIRHVADYMRDPRYIRVGGRPVFAVYKPSRIPDLARMVEVWRTEALREGVGDLHLVAVQHNAEDDHRAVGFDRNLEFAPHGIGQMVLTGAFGLKERGFTGSVHDYGSAASFALAQPDLGLMRYRCTMLGWDNTARVGNRATIHAGFTLDAYRLWLTELCARAKAETWRHPDERFVFINAWNEWAEGTHLEPDQRYGFAYLAATRDAVLSP